MARIKYYSQIDMREPPSKPTDLVTVDYLSDKFEPAQTDDIFLQVDLVDLQTTIDALPKIINANVQILANAGTLTDTIEINGFTGTGSLTIMGDQSSENPTVYVDIINIFNNSLASIDISMFQVVDVIAVYYCYLGTVRLYKIWSTEAVFNGVKVSSSSMVILEECAMQNKTYPYIVNGPGLTFIHNCTYDNYEQYAFYVARGSIALIYPSLPSGVNYIEVEGGKILMPDQMPNVFVLPDPDTEQEIIMRLSAGQGDISIYGDTFTYYEFQAPFAGYLHGYISIRYSGGCEAMMCLQRRKSDGSWPSDPSSGVAFVHEMSTNALVGGLSDIAVLEGETYRIGITLVNIGASAKTCTPDSHIWISKPKHVML